MIVRELDRYYRRLSRDSNSGVAPRFWSEEKASWVLDIDDDGRIVSAIRLLTGEGKGERKFRVLKVPEHGVRSGSGLNPFFLCDNAAYVLGYDEKRGVEKLEASQELTADILGSLDDDGAKVVCRYFGRPDRDGLLSEEKREALKDESGFVVFRLAGDGVFLHERPAVAEAWERACEKPQENAVMGQCSINGEVSNLARLFPQVTGFPGAQSAGASLVSFNSNAYESYGKSQAYNASISEEVAANAGAALKYLCSQPDHNVRLGDTLMVFWTDRPAPEENEIVRAMIDPPQGLDWDMGIYYDETEDNPEENSAESKVQFQRIKQAFLNMYKGKTLDGDFDAETRFFILGLAPNAARLSVRFFETNTFGELAVRYGRYLQDVAMVDVKAFAPRALLLQTAALGKSENIPATFVNSFMRSIFNGTLFPESVYSLVLSRMRADRAMGNRWDMGQRAALLKACLNRKGRLKSNGANDSEEEVFSVSLDRKQSDKGYILGRLFAVMERAQALAIGDMNATIRDRYMGAASVTPARVFPQLFGNLQNHIGKIRKDPATKGRAVWVDRETQEILDLMEGAPYFPPTLTTEEQGAFYVGYYQQASEFWKKNPKKDADSEELLPEG